MNRLLSLRRKVTGNDALLALTIAVGFVILCLAIGYYSNLVIPGNKDTLARYSLEPTTHLDFMSEWDGPHYLSIANHGYSNDSLTAFFPLYPLLIRLVMFVVRSPLISALTVSWLCLVGAIYFYIRILRELVAKNVSDIFQGLLVFLLFPTGVFLAATYTESLFAFLCLGALYFALKGRALPAALFCAFVTAAHPEGVFVIPLIAMLLIEAKTQIKNVAAASIAGLAGIVGYISYLGVSKNKPLDFIKAQQHSHWLSGNYFSTIINSITAIDTLLYLVVLVSVFYWWSRRKSLAIYSLLFVLLPIVGGNFAGYSRYALMAFPAQLMLVDKFRSTKVAYPLLLALSTMLWAYFVIHYAAGYSGG